MNTRRKSDGECWRCGTETLKMTWRGWADFFLEGEETEGLRDTLARIARWSAAWAG